MNIDKFAQLIKNKLTYISHNPLPNNQEKDYVNIDIDAVFEEILDELNKNKGEDFDVFLGFAYVIVRSRNIKHYFEFLEAIDNYAHYRVSKEELEAFEKIESIKNLIESLKLIENEEFRDKNEFLKRIEEITGNDIRNINILLNYSDVKNKGKIFPIPLPLSSQLPSKFRERIVNMVLN